MLERQGKRDGPGSGSDVGNAASRPGAALENPLDEDLCLDPRYQDAIIDLEREVPERCASNGVR